MRKQYIIKDDQLGIYLAALNVNEFLDRVDCAENRRKAKHAGRFSLKELCEMFKVKPNELSQFVNVDEDVPITYTVNKNVVNDIEVTTYNLVYELNFLY